MRDLLLCCLTSLLLASCASRAKAPPPERIEHYRLILELPSGQDLPFFIALPREARDGRAYVLNGEQRTPAEFSRVRVEEARRITLRFDKDSALSLRIEDDGAVRGVWDRPQGDPLAVEGNWAQWTPDFELRRFAPPSLIRARAAGDASGVWRLNFDGSQRPGLRLDLVERSNGVVMAILSDGDSTWELPEGPLAGARFADDIRVGRFDGRSAIVVELLLGARGEWLEGLLWSAAEERPFAFVGEREK